MVLDPSTCLTWRKVWKKELSIPTTGGQEKIMEDTQEVMVDIQIKGNYDLNQNDSSTGTEVV